MAAPIIDAQDLSLLYSGRAVFRGVNLAIHDHDRLGLIGPNGSGKSSLIQMLAGRMESDSGQVTLRRHARIALIEQSPSFAGPERVRDYVIHELTSAGRSETEAHVQADTWLGLTGFANPDQAIKQLSGGWQKRLQIVVGMALEPDVLLLDEPTNHLDAEGVEWLEDLLTRRVRTWLAISHDRFFLQRTTTRTAELDPMYPEGLFEAPGPYDFFLGRKAEWIDAHTQYADSLAARLRREDAWLARGPKARTTKAKSRVDQAHELKSELADARQRLRKEQVNLDFSASGRKTKKLVELETVSKAFGDTAIIQNFDYVVRPQQLLGVVGPNGSGKSTLLKLIAGDLQHDAGQIKPAPDLQVVYFDQHRDQLNADWTLRRALCDEGDSVVFRGRSVHVASWAKRFRFAPDRLDLRVSDLSGGERARVVIARLMLRPADVLLLDEPTNDLDIPTLETLEDSLSDFPGAVILVTHDRYMLQKLCTSVLGLMGAGQLIEFASYDQWQQARADRMQASIPAAKTAPPASAKPKPSSGKKKLSYKDQREFDAMEEKIMVAEEEVERWQTQVDDPQIATQSTKLAEACAALEAAQAEVKKLYDRWAELDAMQGG